MNQGGYLSLVVVYYVNGSYFLLLHYDETLYYCSLFLLKDAFLSLQAVELLMSKVTWNRNKMIGS